MSRQADRVAHDSPHLRHSEAELLDIALYAVAIARRSGLGASAQVSESGGLTVTARGGRAEMRTGDQVQRLSVSIHDGLRQGHASTGKLDRAAIEATVDHARALARFGGEDAEAALPESEVIARNPSTVPLFHTASWNGDELAGQGIGIEAAALEEGARRGVELVIDNAGVSTHDHRVAIAASNGFAGAYSSSSASRWCAAAAGVEGARRIAVDSSTQRDASRLRFTDAIGRRAAVQAANMIGARPVASGRTPVLFENRIARDLVGSLVGALSGGPQMNGGTFLPDSIGQVALATHLSLREDPFVAFGAASAPFDSEGVAGHARDVVTEGVIRGYFTATRSGRRLNMPSTGNASGPYNLFLTSDRTVAADDEATMLRRLGTGLFVTSLSNQGVNMFTGDWSRAATGFWVECGEIAFPVEGVTLSGNLTTMLKNIVAVGADLTDDGAITTGSILIDALDLAGG